LFSSNVLRLKNNNALTQIIEKVFSEYLVKELEEILSNLNIPCSKVYEMSDVAGDKDNFKRKSLLHFKHKKLGDCIIPGNSIIFSEIGNMSIEKAPEIGEDNDKYGL
jgi:crotonobetainyl-CoA:carnitine CoA-transferase CaiB-like acyl-CoA transferase